MSLFSRELAVAFREGVGDVFQEDEADDNVFVFARVYAAAQRVRRWSTLLPVAMIAPPVTLSSVLTWKSRHPAYRRLGQGAGGLGRPFRRSLGRAFSDA